MPRFYPYGFHIYMFAGHHVEIHVGTHYNIETLSEKVRFDDLDRSYEIRKNVNSAFLTSSLLQEHNRCLKSSLQISHNLKSCILCVA